MLKITTLEQALELAIRLREFGKTFAPKKLKTPADRQHRQNLGLSTEWVVRDLEALKKIEG